MLYHRLHNGQSLFAANDNVAILGLPFTTGQISAGGTRFVGNISLEGTSNTTHQLEPYGKWCKYNN